MKKLLIILSSALFLTSCLKDKEYDNGTIGHQVQDQKIVELAVPNSSATSVTKSLDFKNLETTLTIIPVRISSGVPAASDIQIVLDTSSTTAFAAANGFAHFKNTLGSIVSPLTLTIPKGSLESNPITVKVNSINFDPSSKYVLAFKIKSVSDPSYQINANFSTYYIYFSAKNKYDGHYRLQGYHNRVPYTFPYDTEIDLVTTGPNSVIFYWPDVASTGHPIGVGVGALSWYGAGISPVIVFDPATNLVSNVFNNPPNTTVITMFTGAGSRISKFNPADKSITVDWNYNGNPLRAFFDDLTYIGPR